jgi:hypothetical protein
MVFGNPEMVREGDGRRSGRRAACAGRTEHSRIGAIKAHADRLSAVPPRLVRPALVAPVLA